mmetsp:Transcript_32522/g.57490  ORF Transcript_32522/g.57490 Transcript_32522/m.57490 type:complete len:83 (+) Transcript_32522:465-713(+)
MCGGEVVCSMLQEGRFAVFAVLCHVLYPSFSNVLWERVAELEVQLANLSFSTRVGLEHHGTICIQALGFRETRDYWGMTLEN